MACIAIYRNGFPAYEDGDENRVFGKDADKVMKICRTLMDRRMYDIDRPRHPGLDWIKDMWRSKKMTLHDARETWNRENIEAYTQYLNDVKAWENETEKMLGKLYGIAKRHHVHIKWLAVDTAACMSDRFLIQKNGKVFAIVQL